MSKKTRQPILGKDLSLNLRRYTNGGQISFGVATVLLELVPLASILFAFTNTAGAALWAADMEKGEVTGYGTAPRLREQVKKAE